jgi:DNA mismatch repair protein MutL
MSDIIHLLPDNIANQIAAGEVIQRPASAVKELMENSIDSGATKIQLIIKDAGKQLIQVIDNGIGMSETDARMSFERHATSKITRIEDLFAIRTMGFRGEALASIAAVAQVELKSKRQNEETGTNIEIENTIVLKQEPVSCATGTNIEVKNLFFNVPARRQFLKSNPVETRHILDEFIRVALAHPQIHFEMQHNGMEIFHLKAGLLRHRITQLFNHNYEEKIVPVEEETGIIRITGFIGKPEAAKKTRGEQFFFVNNRFIRSSYLNHAVVSSYEQMLPADSYPFYVLFLDIDPARIDINVHPTKQEIKFDDEKIVYSILHASIKHALGKYSVTPTIDFTIENTFQNIPAWLPSGTNEKQENASVQTKPGHSFYSNPKPAANWESLYDVTKGDKQTITVSAAWEKEKNKSEQLGIEDYSDTSFPPVQFHLRYILTQIKNGLVLIDQQAAHERILYEKFLQQMEDKQPAKQQQLFPQTIHFVAADFALMKEILPEVQSLGFDLQEFGENSFVLQGVPSEFITGNETKTLEKLIEGYKQSRSEVKFDKRNQLARSMARNRATHQGEKLSEQEMRQLIDQLFACSQPQYAPDGRLTFITFGLADLEKFFFKK